MTYVTRSVHEWFARRHFGHRKHPPRAGVILAGLLLKTGAYGLLRFVAPLFPDAAHAFAPIAMIPAVIGLRYGGVLAFGQTDFKRLVAYTGVGHLASCSGVLPGTS